MEDFVWCSEVWWCGGVESGKLGPMALHLFEAFGVEIEYMVVDRATLRVAPVVDRLLRRGLALPGAVLGEDEDEANPGNVEFAEIAWSNELALHVLEFKTNGPRASLEGLAGKFHEQVRLANGLLGEFGAMLLPGGMHPTMDPDAEMRIWPHGYNEVYEAFDRIFDCKGHGWANLQSAHLNLPFGSDEEFGKLHAAVRVLLAVMPALCAASPMMEGRLTGLMDNRLEVYRQNARRVPITSGRVVPEGVYTRGEYERVILDSIYRAFEPLDPGGVLRHEWCNSRGAIARFSRGAIEVRVLDCQECPAADVAIISLVAAGIRGLIEGRFASQEVIRGWEVEALHGLLLRVIKHGERAEIAESGYAEMFGLTSGAKAGEVWERVYETCGDYVFEEHRAAIEVLLSRGPLARRMVKRLGVEAGKSKEVIDGGHVKELLTEMAQCLAENRMLV